MKALTLTLCVLALLGSAASGFFYWQIGDTKQTLKEQLSAQTTRADGLDTNLKETTTRLEGLQQRLASTDTELGETKNKLMAAQTRATQLDRDLGSARSQLATKEQQEQALTTELRGLRQELVQARLATAAASPEEIAKYKETIASLEAKVTELSQAVATGTVGGAKPGVAGRAGLSERVNNATVASVGPKNAFVVLELGTADGVAAGQKFIISRGGQAVAEAVLSSVLEQYSVAQVAPASLKSALQAGDSATLAQ